MLESVIANQIAYLKLVSVVAHHMLIYDVAYQLLDLDFSIKC